MTSQGPYLVVEFLPKTGQLRAYGYIEDRDDACDVADYLGTINRWAWVDGVQEPLLPKQAEEGE